MIGVLQARPYRFTGPRVFHGERPGAALTTPGRRRLPFTACRGRWPAAKRPAGWGGTTSLIPTLVASSALTFTSPPCGEVGPDRAAVTVGWGDTTALILPPWTPRSPSTASVRPPRLSTPFFSTHLNSFASRSAAASASPHC